MQWSDYSHKRILKYQKIVTMNMGSEVHILQRRLTAHACSVVYHLE